MAIYHDRDSALRDIRSMPEQTFKDGLLLDVPKRRRREQAMGKKDFRVKLPAELQKRFVTQYNRYVEVMGKDIGINTMLELLEHPTDDRLKELMIQADAGPEARLQAPRQNHVITSHNPEIQQETEQDWQDDASYMMSRNRYESE